MLIPTQIICFAELLLRTNNIRETRINYVIGRGKSCTVGIPTTKCEARSTEANPQGAEQYEEYRSVGAGM